MRLRAQLLATAAVLATAPAVAGAHMKDPGAASPARPPEPAWAPGAAVAAFADVVTRGTEALPDLDALCTPTLFGVHLPPALSFLGTAPLLDLGTRCELPALAAPALPWATPTFGDLGVLLQLELRQIAAGPAGFVARLVPDAPDFEFLPDLTALTTSPVPGVESSGFGLRRDPINHRTKFHRGTDFRARLGTPVYAAGAGRVVFAGQQHGYGNIIYVDHGGGVVTRYAHLSRFEIDAGALVEAGRLIGRVGATGRATGPHLHFEVRLGARAVEPTLAMSVAALERTDPDAARALVPQLSADVQDQVIDLHDPPRAGGSKGGHRRHASPHGSRPERRGAPHRIRTVS
ncbi:MAG TPA: M23 family metallopeptidase [Kofleriaceae bacterium]|nr:M23 family metallopeptidase [Kofleriaceae bacterium]